MPERARGRKAREMQLYTSISEYWNNSNAAFPTFVPHRLYIHRDIRTIARNMTFFTVPRPFFPHRKGGNGQTRTVCGERPVKSDGKEFLTFCRVSSRCESMSPASFGNRDSARSAATPSFFAASRFVFIRWHEKRL